MMNISNKIQFFALSTLLQFTRIIPEFILYKIGFLIDISTILLILIEEN